jgi:hypothetical protein
MPRLVFAILAGFLATQVCAPAHASTLDYTLTFKASSPYAADTGGTGTFELNGPISTSGDHTYSLTELSMTVDGLTFSLSQDTQATVTFDNGVFSGLSFDGTDTTGRFTFDTLGTYGTSYSLVQDDFVTLSQGSISAVDPPATPLPPTAVLFAAGLLLFGAFAWSRRTAQSQSRALAAA